MGKFGDIDGDGRINDDWLGAPIGGAIGLALGSELGPVGALIGGNKGWELGNKAMDYFDDLTGTDGVSIAPKEARDERSRRMQEDPWGTIYDDNSPIVPEAQRRGAKEANRRDQEVRDQAHARRMEKDWYGTALDSVPIVPETMP